MKKGIKDTCNLCELNNYCHYLCRLHLTKMAHQKRNEKKNINPFPVGKICLRAAVGASAGAATVVSGLAILPAAGLKTIIGHALAVKLGAGAGAGINLLHRPGKKEEPEKPTMKRRFFYLPQAKSFFN